VLITSRKTLASKRKQIEGALDAIDDGMVYTRAHPAEATNIIAKAAETKDTGLIRAETDAVLPAFATGLKFNRGVLEQWADFDQRVGLTKGRTDISRAFDLSLRP
jgi:ABC-type nitrate/sulfonate/bicarbonate transport system substrate-binding protein